jgi:hypothetical protein
MLMDYFVEETCCKRPRLEKWGLSTDSWLGSVYHKTHDHRSALSEAFSENAIAQVRWVCLFPRKTSRVTLRANVVSSSLARLTNLFISPAAAISQAAAPRVEAEGAAGGR